MLPFPHAKAKVVTTDCLKKKKTVRQLLFVFMSTLYRLRPFIVFFFLFVFFSVLCSSPCLPVVGSSNR